MAKRIKRLEDSKADYASARSTPLLDNRKFKLGHPQAPQIVARSSSPSDTSKRISTSRAPVERWAAHQSRPQPSASTNQIELPAPASLGKVEVMVTVDQSSKVSRSTQLQYPHTIPHCLLTVGVVPGYALDDSFIFLHSNFWEFHENTRFSVKADGDLVKELCDEGVPGAKFHDIDGGLASTITRGIGEAREITGFVFNFPVAGFKLGGDLFTSESQSAVRNLGWYRPCRMEQLTDIYNQGRRSSKQ